MLQFGHDVPDAFRRIECIGGWGKLYADGSTGLTVRRSELETIIVESWKLKAGKDSRDSPPQNHHLAYRKTKPKPWKDEVICSTSHANQ